MKIASSRKSLLIVIFILLIIDVIILFFFVMKNKPDKTVNRDHRQSGLYSMLTEEVHFNPEQMAKYEDLRNEQQTKLKPLFGGIRKSKDNFYSLLYKNDLSDSLKNILADSIGLGQKNLDLHMFDYFRSVREICREDQLPKFDSSIKKVVMRMTGRRGKGKSELNKKVSDNNQ